MKADPGFAHAWHNLTDLLDDRGCTKEAVKCLIHALEADPDYTDAMYNMALLLQRLAKNQLISE